MIKKRIGDCLTVRTKISGSGYEGLYFQTIKILLVLFCLFARQVVISPSHRHDRKSTCLVNWVSWRLHAKTAISGYNLRSLHQTMVVAIDRKTCALDCLNFNEWRFGIFSDCVLNLEVAVGAVHWVALRHSFGLQRLHHHLAAH